MQLASLARLTHERHFNTRVFKRDELFIPGGLVLGLTHAASARDLHEILYEQLDECSYPNNLNPDDTVGAFTYVSALEEHLSGELECVHLRTVGVKNFDMTELDGQPLPLALLTGPMPKPKALEALCKEQCVKLSKKIVCISDRKVYRQAPTQNVFLL
jgi:citrate lyase subunit beta/citryl-CoA lyase